VAQLPRAERECLYFPQGYDDLNLSVPDKRAIRFFRELIKSLRPDVVHFHDYRGIGVESVRAARPGIGTCGRGSRFATSSSHVTNACDGHKRLRPPPEM
jgi:hypothetical protein